MKKILMINTGGTFSAVEGELGLAPGLTGENIASILGCGEDVMLIPEDYCSLDSANIIPDDWAEIARRIEAAESMYDGVIVIHGTDVMAYTASMLSFMLQNISIPVVLTGSQLPLNDPLTDAADNCRCAIKMASSEVGGVYVVFNRKVILGCRSSKVRTVSFDAFESINYPLIGEFNAFGMQLQPELLPPQGRKLICRTGYSDKIAVLKVFPGMKPDIFSYLQEKGYEGIFIEGFGLGGVPFMRNNLLKEIEKASLAGIPILVGSQCRYEGSNLNIYETGYRVQACGGIPVYDMTQEATVTKLMWCLGQTRDREEIQKLILANMVNEIRPVPEEAPAAE